MTIPGLARPSGGASDPRIASFPGPQKAHVLDGEASRNLAADRSAATTRALSPDPSTRASLHANCVVVDGERALVSSANFTKSA
jgi:phosphatidylserine/phosphatidylglycerophosphate/cardiolipin synthase-like enzyme